MVLAHRIRVGCMEEVHRAVRIVDSSWNLGFGSERNLQSDTESPCVRASSSCSF